MEKSFKSSKRKIISKTNKNKGILRKNKITSNKTIHIDFSFILWNGTLFCLLASSGLLSIQYNKNSNLLMVEKYIVTE